MTSKLMLICIAVAASIFLFTCTSEADLAVSSDGFTKQNNISKEIKVAVDEVF